MPITLYPTPPAVKRNRKITLQNLVAHAKRNAKPPQTDGEMKWRLFRALARITLRKHYRPGGDQKGVAYGGERIVTGWKCGGPSEEKGYEKLQATPSLVERERRENSLVFRSEMDLTGLDKKMRKSGTQCVA